MSSPGGRPAAAAVAGAACISSSAVVMQLAGASPSATALGRCVFALPVLGVLAWLERRRGMARSAALLAAPAPRLTPRGRWLARLAGVFLAADLIVWSHSIADIGAGLGTVITNLQVIIVALVAWLVLGERPRRSLLLASPVMLGGLVLVGGLASTGGYGADPPLGVAFGIVVAVLYSGYILLLRQAAAGAPPVATLFEATAGATAGAIAIGLLLRDFRLGPAWPALGWLVLLALTSQVLGWLLITVSMPRLPAWLVGALLLVQPAGSVLLGALFLRERPSAAQLAGVAAMLGGVLLAARGRPARAEPRQNSVLCNRMLSRHAVFFSPAPLGFPVHRFAQARASARVVECAPGESRPLRKRFGSMGARRDAAPVLSGAVPPLADSFHPRPETGVGLPDTLRPGATVVLVPAQRGDPSGGVSAPSGTGKTQLAVNFAHTLWNSRAVDLLVWVPAGSRASIVASFAQAAGELDAELPGETADAAARRFLGWLSRTQRRWAVILDGVMSAEDLDGLWPAGETGQVVVTTRLSEAELAGPDRTIVGVPGFSLREAVAYIDSRLTGLPDQRVEALDLVEDVSGLPIAMDQAISVIEDRDTSCRDYRLQYAERMRSIAGTVIDGVPQPMLATWSLAVERAHELSPAGLAWPALAFASMLDTGGIPAAALVAPSACGFITGRLSNASSGDQNLVRSAFANLERLGLVSVDKTNAARTVWVHQAVCAAVRAYLPPDGVEQTVMAAAAALLEAWPEPATATGVAGAGAQLGQALRDCAASLWAFAGDLLWKPEAHPLLVRAGASLDETLLADSAIGYWQTIAATCSHLLGPAHTQSVQARDRLAAAYTSAGRLAEAMSVFEAALADRERGLGPEHPDTVAARVNLAQSYQAAGREAEAITLYEQALGQYERLFGTGHRETLAVQARLAAAYQAAGRRGDSIRLHEQTLDDSERALGPTHRDTLAARANLAAAYQSAGQLAEAIAAYQRTLADRERAYGPDHPETLAARSSIANSYRLAGRAKEAVTAYQRVLADRERIQGADHPDAMTARGNLAFAYRGAGKLKDAIAQYERTLADRERVQGPDHRDTLSTRGNLAATYQLARRLRDAIPQYERAVADSERMLGPGDAETLTTRCNLATAYYAAGRPADMITALRRALADAEQYLGPDHPMTATVRDNLRTATQLGKSGNSAVYVQ